LQHHSTTSPRNYVMQTHTLIASIAAAVLTLASLHAVDYNVTVHDTSAPTTSIYHVADLAPVNVYPSAAELRSAALLDNSALDVAGVMSQDDSQQGITQLGMNESQLVMPYYSFGRQIGQISKE
ncbi:MAG: hypothetical protein ACTS5I_13310, partial [Rhodanobacter sp.]